MIILKNQFKINNIVKEGKYYLLNNPFQNHNNTNIFNIFKTKELNHNDKQFLGVQNKEVSNIIRYKNIDLL